MCALLVWLEMGLSVPKFELPWKADTADGREGEIVVQAVPRSGGEKNYVSAALEATLCLT